MRTGEQGFLFITDLTANRRTGAELVVLMVLFIGSQMASTMVMSVTVDKTQQRIMLLLPLFFAALIPNFPAGSDPLLDHDQLLDARAAARGAKDLAAASAGRGGPGAAGRGAGDGAGDDGEGRRSAAAAGAGRQGASTARPRKKKRRRR